MGLPLEVSSNMPASKVLLANFKQACRLLFWNPDRYSCKSIHGNRWSAGGWSVLRQCRFAKTWDDCAWKLINSKWVKANLSQPLAWCHRLTTHYLRNSCNYTLTFIHFRFTAKSWTKSHTACWLSPIVQQEQDYIRIIHSLCGIATIELIEGEPARFSHPLIGEPRRTLNDFGFPLKVQHGAFHQKPMAVLHSLRLSTLLSEAPAHFDNF